MNANRHPDRSLLTDYLTGNLAGDSLEDIARHLETCAECETTVAILEQDRSCLDRDPLVSHLHGAAHVNPFGEEIELQRVLEKLQQVVTFASESTQANTNTITGRLREYELMEKLGEGGMGTVYVARHVKLDKLVALKLLPADRMNSARAVTRFEREMRAVGKLDHPNIVRATDAGEFDGTHFLVMEYVPGQDLGRVANQLGQLTLAAACEVGRQAALGLQHAHESGLIHRDVKPSNLILSTSGTVKLLDLGLARLSQANQAAADLTSPSQLMGTLDYMAPEQGSASHEVTPAADVYGLGATLYRLLAGHAPFGGPQYDSPFRKMAALSNEIPRPLREIRPEVPAELSDLVDRLLAKKPQDRLASAAEVAQALGPFAAGAKLKRLARELAALAEKKRGTPTFDLSTLSHATSAKADTHDSAQRGLHEALPLADADCPQPVARTGRDLPPSRGLRWLLAGGLAGLCVMLGIVIIVRDPFGRERARLSLESGDTLEVREEGQKPRLDPTKKPVDPAPVQPALAQNVPAENGLAAPARLPGGPPLNPMATVERPARIAGVRSWTVEFLGGRIFLRQVEFSPDGRWVAAAYDGGVIRIFDAGTRALRNMFAIPVQIDRGSLNPLSAVDCFSWCPDSQRIVTPGVHPQGQAEIHVWDSTNGKRLQTLRSPLAPTITIHAHPHGDRIATSHRDAKIGIWSLSQGKLLKELQTPQTVALGQLRWSPDGRFLATASGFNMSMFGGLGRVALWDAESLQFQGFPEWSEKSANGPSLNYLAWSPDSRRLAVTNSAAGWKGCLWDVGERKEIWSQRIVASNGAFPAWAPDGKSLTFAGAGSPTPPGNLMTGETLEIYTCPSHRCISWDPNGSQFVGVSAGCLEWWRANSRNSFAKIRSATESNIVEAGGYGIDGFSTATDRYNPSEFRFHLPTLDLPLRREVDRSPDGRSEAWCSLNASTIHFGDLRAKTKLSYESGREVTSISFAPNSQMLAYLCHRDSVLRILEIPDNQLVHECLLPINSLPLLPTWSADSSLIACTNQGSRQHLFIWRLGEQAPFFHQQGIEYICSLAMRPDGKVLAVGYRANVELWDVATQKKVAAIPMKCADNQDALVWQADNVSLGIVNADGVHVYDTRHHLFSHVHQLANVEAGFFSRDGKQFAYPAGGLNHTLNVMTGEKGPVWLRRTIADWIGISPDGHYWESDDAHRPDLVYLAELDSGEQRHFTPAEFESQFGWKNDPSRVRAYLDPAGP